MASETGFTLDTMLKMAGIINIQIEPQITTDGWEYWVSVWDARGQNDSATDDSIEKDLYFAVLRFLSGDDVNVTGG